MSLVPLFSSETKAGDSDRLRTAVRTATSSAKGIYHRLRNQAEYSLARILQHGRSYGWPHHVLFIAGLPKSGTTWLAQLLGTVPGYRDRWPYDPDGCIYDHDVCDALFAALPWDLYSVVKFHTKATPANLAVIEKYGLRTVVMYRDLRDQCVSRYFHVLNEPEHRHSRYYNEAPKEEGLSHCIEVTLEEYVPWVRHWLPMLANHPERFHEVRYEDLRADPCAVLARVLRFYKILLPETAVSAIVLANAGSTEFNLHENLRKRKGTARKGIVGDWRNHFTDRQAEYFHARCGEFLERLGYAQTEDQGRRA